MEKRYPKTLSQGANNTVVALSSTEVAKLFTSEGGEPFDNIFLTKQGIRLIDVGISALRDVVGTKLFTLYVAREQEEFNAFKQYYLSR